MNRQNGGPAFPRVDGVCGGMTLRDYFAGQALLGLLASPIHTDHESPLLARAAYLAADAMLAERNKP